MFFIIISFLINFIKLIHTIPVVYAYLDIPSIIKKGLELCNISIHAIPVVYAYLDIHSIIRKGLELCNISIHAIPVVYAYLAIHSNNCNKQSSKVERVLSAASACSILASMT